MNKNSTLCPSNLVYRIRRQSWDKRSLGRGHPGPSDLPSRATPRKRGSHCCEMDHRRVCCRHRSRHTWNSRWSTLRTVALEMKDEKVCDE